MDERLDHIKQPICPFNSPLEKKAAEIRAEMDLMLRLARENLWLAETTPSSRAANLEDALLMLAHRIRLEREALPEIERMIAEHQPPEDPAERGAPGSNTGV